MWENYLRLGEELSKRTRQKSAWCSLGPGRACVPTRRSRKFIIHETTGWKLRKAILHEWEIICCLSTALQLPNQFIKSRPKGTSCVLLTSMNSRAKTQNIYRNMTISNIQWSKIYNVWHKIKDYKAFRETDIWSIIGRKPIKWKYPRSDTLVRIRGKVL